MKESKRLLNKNAIVIGSGSGIGRAIAFGFAQEGAQVVCADIDVLAAEATAEKIRATGHEASAIGVDVRQRLQVENLLKSAKQLFGRIHVFVYSAGVSSWYSFLDLPEEEWDRVLNINLKGMYLGGQIMARHMVENGGGVIINVTSQLAEVASQNIAHYVASKGGCRMLTQAMALELAAKGVRVNALAPGLTNTNLTRTDNPEGLKNRKMVLPRIPLGRAAEPEEMVGAAVFMASDEASYLHGASIVVDGGYLIM